ncbi:MAG: glycosyltransferase family 4 protein [Candidatus Bathyarchaeia archaeon]
MKIGVMLRHFKRQPGGLGTYTNNLLDYLLKIDTKNHYVFTYKDENLLGSYLPYPNVEEIVVRSSSNLTWDQIAIPTVAKRKELDLIFNPKLTVPIFSRCKKLFTMAGGDWFVFPHNYVWYDRIYHKVFAPLYFRSADAIISISESATQDIINNVKVDEEKIHTIHLGVNEHFRPIDDEQHLEAVARRYNLPEHFILFVGQIYPMKNVGGIIKAFAKFHKQIPHKLVIVGKPGLKYKKELALIDKYNLGKHVTLIGWIPYEDLPAFYNLAELFLFPSLYEGFGIPLLEAMACGCPVVTSNRGATGEVVGDAAMLVDPTDASSISNGVYDVMTQPELRQDLIDRGFKRVKNFSWERCARETLALFESLNRGSA